LDGARPVSTNEHIITSMNRSGMRHLANPDEVKSIQYRINQYIKSAYPYPPAISHFALSSPVTQISSPVFSVRQILFSPFFYRFPASPKPFRNFCTNSFVTDFGTFVKIFIFSHFYVILLSGKNLSEECFFIGE